MQWMKILLRGRRQKCKTKNLSKNVQENFFLKKKMMRSFHILYMAILEKRRFLVILIKTDRWMVHIAIWLAVNLPYF